MKGGGDEIVKINHILFVSPMYRDIKSILENKGFDDRKEVRYRSEQGVTTEDYRWADSLVTFNRPENFQFENIKWVHSLGAGIDKILKREKWKDDVVLTRTICSFGQKISEYCLSYILRDVQNHNMYESFQSKKEWKPIAPTPLRKKQVVIFGTGVIGQEVAKVLTSFGVTVFGVSLSGKAKEPFTGIFSSEDSNYDHYLARADYVINTMPLTEKTRSMFNTNFFHKCSQTCFINIGRGESVHYESLLKALNSGQIRKAVLDVFEEEPLPTDDLLWNHPNVIITPHISAVTTPEEGVECFIDTLHKIENEAPLPNKVDLTKGF